MPGPQPDVPTAASHGPPLSALAGGTALGALNTVWRSQPRLVFSMPYSAAGGAFVTPAGKCTPLMKRTVREESGAMLWLKNAAVRATPMARSSLFGLALFWWKSASTRPARSTTAIEAPPPAEASAAFTMASTSAVESAANGTGVALPSAPSTHCPCAVDAARNKVTSRTCRMVSSRELAGNAPLDLIKKRRGAVAEDDGISAFELDVGDSHERVTGQEGAVGRALIDGHHLTIARNDANMPFGNAFVGDGYLRHGRIAADVKAALFDDEVLPFQRTAHAVQHAVPFHHLRRFPFRLLGRDGREFCGGGCPG